MRLRVVALTLGCLAAASLARAQAPPLSAEFQANTETTSYQEYPDVGMDAAGNFVVVWQSYQNGNTADVYARRFDSNGNAQGSDFLVNTYTTEYQGFPAVAVAPAGAFTVVWGSYAQNETSGSNVYGQRYDSSGNPAGGEFLVNTYTTGYQYGPAIAASPNGSFAVVWSSYLQDGDKGGVYGKTFDASGNPLGSEFAVNQYTTGYQWRPKVAAGGNGDFVVVWESYGQDGDNYAVMARRFGSDGTPRGNEFQVNETTAGPQHLPAVAADAAGDFVVVWDSQSQDGSQGGVFARRFGNAGQPLGSEFQVNTYTSDIQSYPRVAMDAKGNFVVAWESQYQDGSDMGVFAQRFDKNGAKVGGEFQVNVSTTDSQEQPAVALGANGRAVITWDSLTAPSDIDVFARMTAPLPKFLAADAQFAAPSPGAPQSSPLNGVFEPGETVTVVPEWLNDTPADLALTGAASNFTGPSGATYTIQNGSADYGNIPSGAFAMCGLPSSCYSMQVDAPAVRPAAHWDSTFDETLSSGGIKTWTLHIGESFADVPTDNLFYAYIENLFHNGVTGGCAGGGYCPANDVTRAQMAVFLLKSKYSSAYVPPPATGTVFADVPASNPFAPWIENLAALGITGGCGGGNYCPSASVTRAQMAVFLLKTKNGSSYAPPPGTGIFGDVSPCPGAFCNFIEDLYNQQITGGCSQSPLLYCPTSPNLRQQMAVFLVKTFGLVIYGP